MTSRGAGGGPTSGSGWSPPTCPGPSAGGAVRAFTALAEVEARAHGVEVADVHVHEVGAWDSVSDVVGVCAAVEHLQVTEIVVSRIAVGSGTVRTTHGVLAVPVPAVLGLAAGWKIATVGEGELATPTGMALVTTVAVSQGPVPAVRVLSSGVGAGTKETSERVLARPDDVAALRDLVLTHKSTIGVRSTPVRRWALERSWVPAPRCGQAVQVKVAHRAGRIAHATPEFRATSHALPEEDG